MRAAILIAAVVLLAATASVADVSDKMSYQGVLTDAAGNPLNGTYDITFRLYNVDSGGTVLWEETQSLPVEAGIVNAYLGSVVPIGETLDFSEPYWMGISVEGEAELTPRRPLTTVPYAARAVHVDEPAPDDDWVIDEPNIYTNLSGGVGIGDTTPEWFLDIYSPEYENTYMQITNGVTGDATWTGLFLGVSATGDAWVSQGSSQPIHLGRGAAAHCVNVFNSGNVSVGLISDPDDKLEVDGTVEMTGFKMPTGAASGLVLMSDGNGEGTWQSFPAVESDVSAAGNVVLDAKGEARVEVPASLAGSELLYQLTCIGGYAPVYVAEKERGGVFVIAGGRPGMEISWQVSQAR